MSDLEAVMVALENVCNRPHSLSHGVASWQVWAHMDNTPANKLTRTQIGRLVTKAHRLGLTTEHRTKPVRGWQDIIAYKPVKNWRDRIKAVA